MASYRDSDGEIVRAVRFRSGEQSSEMDWLTGDMQRDAIRYPEDGTLLVRCVEGAMVATSGDWIVRDVDGLHHVKPSDFRRRYQIDLSHAPVSAAAIAADAGEGNCPTCGLSGVTPERARREAPRWYAALLSTPSMAVPDEPSACCWDCRRMIAAGLDPAAIIEPDHAEYVAARAGGRP